MSEPLRFRSWEESATGDWSPSTGLYRLRDDTPQNLASWMWEQGKYVQRTATIELLAHGNPRKAAEFVRALADQHPLLRQKIRQDYDELSNLLFDTPLEQLPASPKEYSLIDRLKSVVNRLFTRK